MLLALAAWLLRIADSGKLDVNHDHNPPADRQTVAARETPAAGETLTGRVVHVGDGDTLTLQLPAGERRRVRLAWIDAPELAQAGGEQAKQVLDRKVYRREVTVQVVDTDPYGRIVGLVRLGDRDINAEMVAEGWAWDYRHYNHSPQLEALEQSARQRHLGLWADEHPMPPWDFRQTAPEREKRRARQHDSRHDRRPTSCVWPRSACRLAG